MEENNVIDGNAIVADTIEIGGKIINKDDVTPADYFDYVKGLKQEIDDEYLQKVIDNGLKMINRTKITKQTAMAAQISHEIELALRELKAARAGFDIFVARKEIEKYITNVEGKAIKIIELSKYTREIPDDVVDKLEKANDLFDEFYIVFTDYTMKETKKIAKERREKDPILFGAFMDKSDPEDKTIYIEDRLFFIADWVEEKCDLTLKEIVEDVKNSDGHDIIYKVNCPEDEESIKKILKSFEAPAGRDNKDLQPEKNFFAEVTEAVKNVIKKRSSKRRKKSIEDDEE